MNPQIEKALADLKAGTPERVERAIATLQDVVYGFGIKVCKSPEDAEDTAQETLIRLARQLKEFPDARALSVWLYKVAKTQCMMSRRKSKFAPDKLHSLDELVPRSEAGVKAAAKSWEITPEETLLNHELRNKLESAVLSLPKHYRLVLILRDVEQLDPKEVAEVMGISEATTKKRLHRARTFVRNALAAYLPQSNTASQPRG